MVSVSPQRTVVNAPASSRERCRGRGEERFARNEATEKSRAGGRSLTAVRRRKSLPKGRARTKRYELDTQKGDTALLIQDLASARGPMTSGQLCGERPRSWNRSEAMPVNLVTAR